MEKVKYRRYTKNEVADIRKIYKNCGCDYKATVVALNAVGMLTTRGKEFKYHDVYGVASKFRVSSKKSAAIKKEVVESEDDGESQSIQELIIRSNLPAQVKISALKTLMGV